MMRTVADWWWASVVVLDDDQTVTDLITTCTLNTEFLVAKLRQPKQWAGSRHVLDVPEFDEVEELVAWLNLVDKDSVAGTGETVDIEGVSDDLRIWECPNG